METVSQSVGGYEMNKMLYYIIDNLVCKISGISDRGCFLTGEESPGFIGQDAG